VKSIRKKWTKGEWSTGHHSQKNNHADIGPAKAQPQPLNRHRTGEPHSKKKKRGNDNILTTKKQIQWGMGTQATDTVLNKIPAHQGTGRQAGVLIKQNTKQGREGFGVQPHPKPKHPKHGSYNLDPPPRKKLNG